MFEEHLAGWGTLRIIERYFSDQDIKTAALTEQEQVRLGQRRHLVHSYYKSVDWEDPMQISKTAKVFEEILNDTGDTTDYLKPKKEKLTRALQSDGFVYKNNRVTASANFPTPAMRILQQTELVNTTQSKLHMARIENSIESELDLAIGNAKELLQAICKNILDKNNIPYSNRNDLPDLMKLVSKELKLTPADVHENAKG